MARTMRFTTKPSTAREGASPVSAEEIAKVAFELFEQRGRAHGHDLEDWLAAERIVRQRRRNGNGR